MATHPYRSKCSPRIMFIQIMYIYFVYLKQKVTTSRFKTAYFDGLCPHYIRVRVLRPWAEGAWAGWSRDGVTKVVYMQFHQIRAKGLTGGRGRELICKTIEPGQLHLCFSPHFCRSACSTVDLLPRAYHVRFTSWFVIPLFCAQLRLFKLM